MEDYPKNMLEFEDLFANEEACREYLCQMRWPDGFICPKCNRKEFWFIKIVLYQCKRCKFLAKYCKMAVKRITLFHYSSNNRYYESKAKKYL